VVYADHSHRNSTLQILIPKCLRNALRYHQVLQYLEETSVTVASGSRNRAGRGGENSHSAVTAQSTPSTTQTVLELYWTLLIICLGEVTWSILRRSNNAGASISSWQTKKTKRLLNAGHPRGTCPNRLLPAEKATHDFNSLAAMADLAMRSRCLPIMPPIARRALLS
jgi:hypothetical protein